MFSELFRHFTHSRNNLVVVEIESLIGDRPSRLYIDFHSRERAKLL